MTVSMACHSNMNINITFKWEGLPLPFDMFDKIRIVTTIFNYSQFNLLNIVAAVTHV